MSLGRRLAFLLELVFGRTVERMNRRARVPDPLYDHPQREKRQEVAKVSSGSGIELPELDYEPEVEGEDGGDREDAFDSAIRMAFVGAGQGGGRIAEAFAKLGYARVAAVNTTNQDLVGLNIDHRLVIGNNRGGAGKDPEQGRLAATESAEDIMDLLMRAWGPGVEQCFVCVGSGGGCVSGDSLLYTSFCGGERLDRLYDRLAATNPVWRHPSGSYFIDTSELGICTMSWSPEGYGLRPISRVWKHDVPLEDQRVVSFCEGPQVETSRWHPFARVRDASVEWVAAEELSVGDVVLGGAVGRWPAPKDPLTLAGVLVDEHVGWALGAICGDGYLSYHEAKNDWSVGLVCMDEEVLAKFEALAAVLGGTVRKRTIRLPDNRSQVARIGTAAATKKVQELSGLSFGHKGEWSVPEVVWKSPRSVAAAFLAGLLDTDGCVSDTSFDISFTTTSATAKDAICGLLNLLIGAQPRVTVRRPWTYSSKKDRSKHATTYEVAVRGAEATKELAKLVLDHMVCPTRVLRLRQLLLRRPSGGSVETFAVPFEEIKSCCALLRKPSVVRGFKLGAADVGAWMRGRCPTLGTARKVFDYLENEAHKLLEWGSRDPVDIWERVRRNGVPFEELVQRLGCSRAGLQKVLRVNGCHGLKNVSKSKLRCKVTPLLEEELAAAKLGAKEVLRRVSFWRRYLGSLLSIKAVETSGVKADLYDLTVPGAENYLAGKAGLAVVHNSGTGSWPKLVDLVWEYCRSTDIEKPFGKHVGVIMTLPKRSEGARVQRNALTAIQTALQLSKDGKIGSLVLVDNAKIHELFPRLPVKRFWSVANQNFAAVLHTFNLLGAQSSEYATFDRADLRSIIRNGLMIFGMTRVHRWQQQEDVSRAVRKNLAGTLLAEGFDLSRANMAGAIVVAHDDVLAQIPMENLDYAFNSLGRVLGNEGITLHNGIYEGRQAGVRVFTIISGLEPPLGRLGELEALSA